MTITLNCPREGELARFRLNKLETQVVRMGARQRKKGVAHVVNRLVRAAVREAAAEADAACGAIVRISFG